MFPEENRPNEALFNMEVVSGLAIAVNVLVQLLDERGILPVEDVLESLRTQHSRLKEPNQQAVAHGVNMPLSSLDHVVRNRKPEPKQTH
ncbi:hypothetical protein KQZ11_004075 [Salmonella enterica]|nr:hypothetical protein [Salmonella enterica]